MKYTPRQKAAYWGVTKNKVQLYVSPYMHELITNIHKKYPSQEWSGIAKLEQHEDWYMLTDIVFWEQENSATLTTITDRWAEEILEKIFERDPRNMGKWICRLHSHHHMQCFWSGTDEEMKQQLDDGNRTHFFHIVTNRQWDKVGYKGALTIYKPYNIEFDADVTVIDWDVVLPESITTEFQKIDAEMAEELSIFTNAWPIDRNSSSLEAIANIVLGNKEEVKDEVIELLHAGAERAKEMIISRHETKKTNLVYGKYINELVSCVNRKKDDVKIPIYQKWKTYTYKPYSQKSLLKWGRWEEWDDDDYPSSYYDTTEETEEVDGEEPDLMERLKLYSDKEIWERLEDLCEDVRIHRQGDRMYFEWKQYFLRDLVMHLVHKGFISYSDF